MRGTVRALLAVVALAVSAGVAFGATQLNGVATAKKLVMKEERFSATKPNLPPVAVGQSLKGKTIYYIASGLSFPFSQEVSKGVKDAATAVGVSDTVVDSGGDPSKASSLLDQAVSQKASAIILQGTDPGAVTAALQGAKSAHIPVVSVGALNEGAVSPAVAAVGLSANASFDYIDVARRLAHLVVAESNGKADVVFVGSSTFKINGPTEKAFKTELHRLCPSCKLTLKDSPLTQWATGLASQTKTILTNDPKVNYIVPVVDAMVLYMKPAIFAAHAQGRVKILSQNASLQDMQSVAKRNDPEIADVGGPEQWLGWAAADEAFRVMLGKPSVANEHVPNRTFTRNNIRSINLKANESAWYGGFDFRAYYKHVWGK
jgi:ribose transport system substrate-binding protein